LAAPRCRIAGRSLLRLLATLGWPGEGLDSREHQARQRWGTLVAEFGACDDFVGAVGCSEAAGLLREMADNVLFEPEELRAPLLVIDAETCAGMSFDGLWVCRLDDAQWPPAATGSLSCPVVASAAARARMLPQALPKRTRAGCSRGSNSSADEVI
jgi:hypothetical protein